MHPGVGLDLLEGEAGLRVVREEAEDEVLEVLAEASAVHLLEVGVDLALDKEVVEVLFFAGLLEREDALNNDEEDDSDGEHVNLSALVLLALLDLRCHVGHGATIGVEVINVLVAGKAEVSELQVKVVVDENVFELQVAVNDTARVHKLNRLDHLVEEETACVLAHGAHVLTEVEEEATLDEFHHDEDEAVDDATGRFHNLAGIAVLVHVDDALVLEVLQNGDLVVD